MRRHRVFLICTVGLCVISFLHYYKALHYVSLLRELSAPYPNIRSFIMVTGFFWKEGRASQSSLVLEEEQRTLRSQDGRPAPGGDLEDPGAPEPWRKPGDMDTKSGTTEMDLGSAVREKGLLQPTELPEEE
ncbi:hypothetical protein DNTS_002054 [Danionella cerebrum]|uniref:Uncharacterized protein n=1 Tax=Danionella cerebrum TaxID=2873325 RepID=A0A553MZ09_9TELE|nr:hypothetical protein DNTS_002054 [Danionella translucida]